MSTRPKLALVAIIVPTLTLCAQMQSEAHAFGDLDFGALPAAVRSSFPFERSGGYPRGGLPLPSP